jgi:thermolysin
MKYQWDSVIGIPVRLRGKLSSPVDGDPLTVAHQFLTNHRAAFALMDVDRELVTKTVKRDTKGNTHIRLQQNWRGFPVFGAELIVHIAADNTISGTNGQYHRDIDAVSKPSISADDAMAAAKKHAGEASEIPGQKPRLEVFHQEDKYTLCWHVRLDSMEGDNPVLWEYFIDAKNADVVFRYNNLQFHSGTTGWGRGRYAGCIRLNTYHNHSDSTYQLRDTSRSGIEIKTYDMNGGTNRDLLTLSANSNNRWTDTNRNPRRDSREPETDAHHYYGIVVDYFLNTFGRNSWDDTGSDAEVCMHYGINQTGSFWDTVRHRVYHPDGNGIGIDYKSSLDVIAHEFTHGVTQTEVDLNYWGESGSLCESYSDFFACMIQGDWVFEEHLYLGATAPNDALRSLYDPTLYGNPDHYSNIGANMHGNSGIPSKAGYLMTHGGTHNNIEVYGLGREVAEQIWYRALHYLTPSTNFADFRLALEDACDDLYPLDAWKSACIQNALAAVGVGSSVNYPTCPTLSITEVPCQFRAEFPEAVEGPVEAKVAGCCSRELILESPPACLRGEIIIGFEPGPCCTRELILESPALVCEQGDIPVFTPVGCQKETLIIGRLTEGGRVESLTVRSGQKSQPLRHVRILTQKRRI